MAIAERMLNARLGGDVIDHHTYVIAGDGCLMEGISHEAISLAGHLGLGKLIVLFDDNSISIDGPTSLAVSDDQVDALQGVAAGTRSRSTATTPTAISAALAKARADSSKPWLIACKTTIGYGAPTKAGKASTHGEPLGEEEIKGAREKLALALSAVRGARADPLPPGAPSVQRGAKERAAWKARVDGNADGSSRASPSPPAQRACRPSPTRSLQPRPPSPPTRHKRATRVWSQMTLEHLVPVLPELIGGSADLTGSNGTAPSCTRRSRRATSPATTSTTACASTAWPPP